MTQGMMRRDEDPKAEAIDEEEPQAFLPHDRDKDARRRLLESLEEARERGEKDAQRRPTRRA